MVESAKPFRFLTDAEFTALEVRARADYLFHAQQELEQRQEHLRSQRQLLVRVLSDPANLHLRDEVRRK